MKEYIKMSIIYVVSGLIILFWNITIGDFFGIKSAYEFSKEKDVLGFLFFIVYFAFLGLYVIITLGFLAMIKKKLKVVLNGQDERYAVTSDFTYIDPAGILLVSVVGVVVNVLLFSVII